MRRHNFDPISFVSGALFAAIGLTFLFGDADIGDLHIAVVWPLPLIVIGILMLVSTVQRRNREAPATAAASRAIRDERSEHRLQPASTPTPTDGLLLDDDGLLEREPADDAHAEEREDDEPRS